MARYVKVSTIGGNYRTIPKGTGKQEAVERMIEYWEGKLQQVLPDNPDLIVLPEACDRYQNHTIEERIQYYKTRKDQVLEFFKDVAKKHNCYIAYSAAREVPDGSWRNSTQIIDRSGEVIGIYNKNHVVIEETTRGGILCGREAPVIKCDFGTVACAICFDLNFDEIRLKYIRQKPDMILFSSMYHGGLMQAYWAYSCRAHFIGSVTALPCTIISPVGEILASSTNYFDFATHTINLDCRVIHLDYNREKLQLIKNKYGSRFKVSDPGYLAAVLISSETDEFTIDDIVDEFKLELLDNYMERSLAHRHNPKNMESI
ncbi:MAG: carbon-nitrogen hydrolase family protein [Clostridiaceae bacterium]|nr:carbon-nitrogen hydrolase family protein [Clostridiaceae bacterium]